MTSPTQSQGEWVTTHSANIEAPDDLDLGVRPSPPQPTLHDLLDAGCASPLLRAIVAAHNDLLDAYDRMALRLAAATSGLSDPDKRLHQRYLDQALAARRQAERAAVRHVRVVVGMMREGER